MKIKLVKINRHKWFPFIFKDVVFNITKDNGEEINIQPMSIGWIMSIKNVDNWDMDVDDELYDRPWKREWSRFKSFFLKIIK